MNCLHWNMYYIGMKWLHWYNPGQSPHLRVIWLVTWIPSAAFIPLFHVIYSQSQGLLWECSAAAAKSLQSCPTLCNPIDGSPPGSPVPGILQARTLEWVAISFSSAWKWKVKVKGCSEGHCVAYQRGTGPLHKKPQDNTWWLVQGYKSAAESHCYCGPCFVLPSKWCFCLFVWFHAIV